MRRARFLAVLTTAVLVGCALTTPPGHEENVRRALPDSTAVPSTWAAHADSTAVADAWIRTLDDPTLESLVAEAMENNLDLAQAAERVLVARQALVLAGARLRPLVGAEVGGRSTVDSDSDGATNSSIITAGVAWELDVWGKLRARREAVGASAQATALDYEYARQSLAATVARAWYLACEAKQLLDLAEQSVVVYEDLSRLVKIRREAGKDTDLNIADTNAKVALARAGVETAKAAYGESRRALESLLGRYPAAEIHAATVLPALPPPPDGGVPASLLERRPDVVAAEQRVLAAFRQEESARLALLPGFSFSLVAGRLGSQLLSLLQLNPWLASAALGMTVPIYEGGALKAQVEIATAEQARAVAAYGAAALSAFREVEDTLANEEFIARRLPYMEAALADTTKAVDIATIQYQAGSRDLLWVSTLQTDELLVEADLIKTRSIQRTNRINLYLALGGSFDEDPAVRDLGEVVAEIGPRPPAQATGADPAVPSKESPSE
jgi:NodT family efflux transporter outer membrane factor (OMF) lipoprotein